MGGHLESEKKDDKSPKSKSKPPSDWMTHLKKFYEAEKKKNPKYKYKDAMKDAKKTYKPKKK